ncbi:unnamed protein product [Rhodiola kirilowii]
MDPLAPAEFDAAEPTGDGNFSVAELISSPLSLVILMRRGGMVGQSRKWTILVATIWIQAFTVTNFDFSSYSSDLKSVLGISQLQLNYLSVASDLGKAFGWCSGVALLYVPLWVVMLMAAVMGLVGYGLLWAVIQELIYVPYFLRLSFMAVHQ